MSGTLPELPESLNPPIWERSFSADQMHAYARSCIAAALADVPGVETVMCLAGDWALALRFNHTQEAIAKHREALRSALAAILADRDAQKARADAFRQAEQETSAAYARLRSLIPSALQTLYAPTPKDVQDWTEQRVRVLLDKANAHEKQLCRISNEAFNGRDARQAPDGDRTIAGLVIAEVKALRARAEAAEAKVASLEAALREVAKRAEALKLECGMDPESPRAIQNGRYMGLAYFALAALEDKP